MASDPITASLYHEECSTGLPHQCHSNRRKEGHGNLLHSWHFNINNSHFAVTCVTTYIRHLFMGFPYM